MRRVTFAVTYPPDLRHPLHRRLLDVDGAERAELLTWGPTADVTALLWVDGGRAVARDLLGAVGSLTTAQFVVGDGGTYAFVHQREYEFDDAVMALVSRSRVAFLPPVTFLDGGVVEFEAAGGAGALGEFYEGLGELGSVTVERVGDFERGRAAPSARLTDRQRSALETAVAAGYYDVPRTGSVREVAAELDCAASTAGELLRKAEAAVVSGYVGAT